MAAPIRRWREPAFANPAFEETLIIPLSRRDDFGNGAAAIGNDDGLARRGEANVFA